MDVRDFELLIDIYEARKDLCTVADILGMEVTCDGIIKKLFSANEMSDGNSFVFRFCKTRRNA